MKSDELAAVITVDLLARNTNRALAAALNCCETTIRRYRRRLGVPPAKTGAPRGNTNAAGNHAIVPRERHRPKKTGKSYVRVEEVERMVALAREGKTIAEITRLVARPEPTVRLWLSKSNVQAGEHVSGHGGMLPEQIADRNRQVIEMFQSGLVPDLTAIGARMGISRKVVRGILEREGLVEPSVRSKRPRKPPVYRPKAPPPPPALPVIDTGWIKPPTLAQLMGRR